jgi:dolichol-phosphate mannosyltransferase
LADIHPDRDFISIIVPTYREAENIPILSREIDQAMKASQLPYEIIIVDDDSGDGIIEAVDELKKSPLDITLIVRKRERGLSSAVLEGLRGAAGDIAVVVDADLSHPPQKIPALVAPLIRDEADFVIGSRFTAGGSADHFTWRRKLNALAARLLARPLTRVTDPMAGFFAFRRKLLTPGVELNPLGFKIGMEIIVKAAPPRITEIGIHFQQRRKGESKLSLREQVNYIIHLKRLYAYRWKARAR